MRRGWRSANIGAFNLDNAIGAALEGAVITVGFGNQAVRCDRQRDGGLGFGAGLVGAQGTGCDGMIKAASTDRTKGGSASIFGALSPALCRNAQEARWFQLN